MIDENDEYRAPDPGIHIYLLLLVLGATFSAIIAGLVAGLLLATTSLWLAISLGAVAGIVGLLLGEGIGDAIMLTSVIGVVAFLLIPLCPGFKFLVVPLVIGFCAGKLLSGIWNEMRS